MDDFADLLERQVVESEQQEKDLWNDLRNGMDAGLFSRQLELIQSHRMHNQTMLWQINSQSYFVALVDGKAMSNPINYESLQYCKASNYKMLAYGVSRKEANKFIEEYVYVPPVKNKWYEWLLILN